MKKIRNILWGLVGFNAISVLCFWLPPGRYYYMPKILADITICLSSYCTWIMPFLGIIGAIITLLLIIKQIRQKKLEKNMIILFMLFLLTIPLGKFLLDVAMSV